MRSLIKSQSAAVCSFLVLAVFFLCFHTSRIQQEYQRQDRYLRISLAEQSEQNQRLQDALRQQQAVLAAPSPPDDHSGFAYVFYATADSYACSVLVNIERLQYLHARYPVHILASSALSQPYLDAFEAHGAVVHIEEPPPLPASRSGYYDDCLLKLLSFKLHQLSPGLQRVLVFDSDQFIMRNLDDLFTALPPVDLASPRAYWLGKDVLATTFMMISLSDRLWDAVSDALSHLEEGDFDMDVINKLLGDQVMMLGGEYVALNSHWEDWNLPKWYHPESTLNMTSIDRVNEFAKSHPGGRKANPMKSRLSYSQHRQRPKIHPGAGADTSPYNPHRAQQPRLRKQEQEQQQQEEEQQEQHQQQQHQPQQHQPQQHQPQQHQPQQQPQEQYQQQEHQPQQHQPQEQYQQQEHQPQQHQPQEQQEQQHQQQHQQQVEQGDQKPRQQQQKRQEAHPPSPPSTSLSASLSTPPTPPSPLRFPPHHPLTLELHKLQSFAAVIHFTAVGKPWTVTDQLLQSTRPDAHPVLAEQFHTWRMAAKRMCPGWGSWGVKEIGEEDSEQDDGGEEDDEVGLELGRGGTVVGKGVQGGMVVGKGVRGGERRGEGG